MGNCDNWEDYVLVMARNHAADMAEAQRAMANVIRQKDSMTQKMMAMMIDQFRTMMKDANEKNGRHFNQLLEQVDKQDKRETEWQKLMQTLVDQFRGMMKDVNERSDRQLAKVKECFEVLMYEGEGLNEDQNQLGTLLMEMVTRHKQELLDKYGQPSLFEPPRGSLNDSVTASNVPLLN